MGATLAFITKPAKTAAAVAAALQPIALRDTRRTLDAEAIISTALSRSTPTAFPTTPVRTTRAPSALRFTARDVGALSVIFTA